VPLLLGRSCLLLVVVRVVQGRHLDRSWWTGREGAVPAAVETADGRAGPAVAAAFAAVVAKLAVHLGLHNRILAAHMGWAPELQECSTEPGRSSVFYFRSTEMIWDDMG
jgi:hypothetical protein